MIVGELLGVERTLGFFEAFPEKARAKMSSTVKLLAIQLQNLVKSDFLSGQALNVQTGKLRRSITQKTTETPTSFTGIVGTNTVYAAIHEFGGRTKPHEIRPVHARSLLFKGTGLIGPTQNMTSKMGRYLKTAKGAIRGSIDRGELQFAKVVHHPGSKMPQRSFLRAALDRMAPEIRDRLQQAMNEATK